MSRPGTRTSGQRKYYLDRLLFYRALKVRGVTYPRLNDLLLAIGKNFPVEEAVVEVKRQHLVDVSSAAFYRWRRELIGDEVRDPVETS